jgi:hypothetical protein
MMRRFTNALLVASALFAVAVQAQETAPADDPAVEQAAEREALEPQVSSAALEEDIEARRRDNGGARVIDRLDLDRTEITGNQELPKVLYIVPWQKSDPGDLMGRPVNSLLDEVLAPLDREEFIRQVDYHSDLYGVAGEEE